MKKSVLSIIGASLFLISCSKQHLDKQPVPQSQTNGTTAKKDGGDDDDDPIVMNVTIDHNGNPIVGSSVMFTSNGDTVSGLTNVFGYCKLKLTFTGIWILNISSPGFTDIQRQVAVLDSFTALTDTLQTGQ